VLDGGVSSLVDKSLLRRERRVELAPGSSCWRRSTSLQGRNYGESGEGEDRAEAYHAQFFLDLAIRGARQSYYVDQTTWVAGSSGGGAHDNVRAVLGMVAPQE